MPHDLSHLGFIAGQIGRLITISTTPVIAGDSFEMDAVGALRLSPLRRGFAIDSALDICTFYDFSRVVFCFQAEDGIRDLIVTGVQTCALPIWLAARLMETFLLPWGFPCSTDWASVAMVRTLCTSTSRRMILREEVR